MRVFRVTLRASMAGSVAFRVGLEQRDNAPAQLLTHLAQVHLHSAFGRAVHLEVVPVKVVEPLHRLDDEVLLSPGT